MWNEALNQAGVEASSALRRAKNVYFLPAIRAFGPASSKTDIASEVADMGKARPTKVLPVPNNPSKVAEQPGVVEKETNTTKGVAPDARKPLTASQDLLKEKEVPTKMEIILATLPMPTKGDLMSKGLGALEVKLSQSTKAPAKEKIIIKKKYFSK